MIPLDSIAASVDSSRLNCTTHRLQVESCVQQPTGFKRNSSSPSRSSRRSTRFCSRISKMTSSPETTRRRRRELPTSHVLRSISQLGTGSRLLHIEDNESCRNTLPSRTAIHSTTSVDTTVCLDSPGVSTGLPLDPRHWSREDVRTWLTVCHQHLNIDADRFPMNGKALCIMTPEMFNFRVPLGGATLFTDFRRRLYTSVVRSQCLTSADEKSSPLDS